MNRKLAAAVVVLTVIGIGSVASLHGIGQTNERAQLLWNADEAYLFISTLKVGWSESYVRFAVGLMNSALGYGDPPQDKKFSMIVLRITPSSVETHVVDDQEANADGFTVHDHRIHDGASSWWTGSHFERLTEDQRRAYLTAKPPQREFDSVDGWSKRYLLPVRTSPDGNNTRLLFGGKSVVITVTSQVTVWKTVVSSIDIQREGQPVERAWSLDDSHRLVSKDEFDAFFR